MTININELMDKSDTMQVEKVFDAIYKVWYETGLDILGADFSAFIANVCTEMRNQND